MAELCGLIKSMKKHDPKLPSSSDYMMANTTISDEKYFVSSSIACFHPCKGIIRAR